VYPDSLRQSADPGVLQSSGNVVLAGQFQDLARQGFTVLECHYDTDRTDKYWEVQYYWTGAAASVLRPGGADAISLLVQQLQRQLNSANGTPVRSPFMDYGSVRSECPARRDPLLPYKRIFPETATGLSPTDRAASPAPTTPPPAAPAIAPGTRAAGPDGPPPDKSALWYALVGTWTGKTGSPERTITVEFVELRAGPGVHVRMSDGFRGPAATRINSGKDTFSNYSGGQVTLNGTLSPDAKTITGEMTVAFWDPKTVRLTLTKR
jgi:hypothetical protein